MPATVKWGLCVALMLSWPCLSRAESPDAPPAADDFSSHEWELTPYLKGTPEQLREKMNGETERLIRKVKETQQAIKQGTLDCQNDEKLALDTLHKSPLYKQTAAEKTAAEADLETARKTGTPQDRLDASSRFNKARAALDQMDHNAVSKSDTLLQDRRTVFEAQKNLKNFDDSLDKAVEWRNELVDATRNGFMIKGPIEDGSKGTLPRVTVESIVGDNQVLVGYDLLTFDMSHPGKDREGIKVFPATKAKVHVLVTGMDTKNLKVGDKTSFDRVFMFDGKKTDPQNGTTYVVKPFPCDADRLFETVVPLRETMPDRPAKAASKP